MARALILVVLLAVPRPALAAESTDRLTKLEADAAGGNVAAQHRLGALYADGEGVARDCVEAARWLRQAAEKAFAAAFFRLGALHAEGCGVPADDHEAVRLYRRAAEAMDDEAGQALGYMYYAGRGVPRNEASAVRWFRRARDQPWGLNPRWVARDYDSSTNDSGPGLPKDDVLAYFWYTIAASQDERTTPRSLRDAVAGRLSAPQIAQAERLLDEWRRTLERSLEDWVYFLGFSHPLAEDANKRVLEMGPAAVPTLLAVLESAQEPLLIRRITQLLTEIDPPAESVVPALRRMLVSRPPTRERIFIAIALASVAPDDAAEARPDLERGVRDGDRESIWHSDCVWALARVGAPESAPVLLGLLEDKEPIYRADAAWGLRNGPLAAVRAPLEKRLRDPVVRVRVRAASSLVALDHEPPPGAVAALVEAIGSGDERDGAFVAMALDERGALLGSAEKDLEAYLHDAERARRGRAAVVLAAAKPERARELIDPLREALASENGYLRLVAAQTLARLGRLARAALPDLEKAAAADPSLRRLIERMTGPPDTLAECGGDVLRLVAVVPGEDGRHRGFVLCEGRRLWEPAPGTRFLDGRVERIGPESMELVLDGAGAPRTLRLFDAGEPPKLAVAPRFTGPPLNIAFEGELAALVRLMGVAYGLNVLVETDAKTPVKVSARDTPWDAVFQYALAGASLDSRVEREVLLRVARRESLAALRPLPPREPTESPISLDFSHGDIRDVARLFQDILGLEVVLPAGEHEPLSVHVVDRPADEVFDWIVASRGWTSRREGTRVIVEAPPAGP